MIKKNFLCIISIFTISYASEVTFIVDMSEETIETGNGNYPAVYLSGVDINGPSGLEMEDNGDGTWQITVDLQPGGYTYSLGMDIITIGTHLVGKVIIV